MQSLVLLNQNVQKFKIFVINICDKLVCVCACACMRVCDNVFFLSLFCTGIGSCLNQYNNNNNGNF